MDGGTMTRSKVSLTSIAIIASLSLTIAMPATRVQAQQSVPAQLGALAPANLAKPRPVPPFNLTGTWLHDLSKAANKGADSWRFVPPTFKLTPQAQVHYDASQKAAKEGKVYRDDIGQCWPAGMPLIMTRVWPIAMIQLPTAIYMISHFMNSLRIIYLDGRSHTDPDILVPSFNGESIGRWEGDMLVVDTKGFIDDHHWMDQGGASIPASDALHIIERIRMINNGATLEIEYTMTDPKSWEGEWKMSKRWNRVDDTDITEVECLPDLNEHLPATSSKSLIR
jgi:hypothetical protein